MTDKNLQPIDQQETIANENKKGASIVEGSAWVATGSFISRLLGALYIIPWMAWIGDPETGAAAHTLYQVSYHPYGFFLSLASAGVPAAIAKQVSYYNARQQYHISRKIYKQGLVLMAITGALAAVIMYLLAPWIAATSPIADASVGTAVIRTLVPALLIIPMQAAIRGFIQGHSRMREPAISQIIEQLARIIFILVSVYVIRQILNGSVVIAVGFSTFAAFIGAIFSMIYLFIAMRKLPTAMNQEAEVWVQLEEEPDTMPLLLDILRTAIPFVIMATGITIFQIIDQQTFSPLMNLWTDYSDQDIQLTYGIVQANAFKLSTLATSFGAAVAGTSVPILSDAYGKNDKKAVVKTFEEGFQLLMLVMFPAAAGMIAVAEPIYTIFYGQLDAGTLATQLYAIVSIFMSIYLLLGSQLQAINERRNGVYALCIGFLVKILIQPFAVGAFHAYGMLLSTSIGLIVTIIIMTMLIQKRIPFDINLVLKRSLLILILSVIMLIGLFFLNQALLLVFNPEIRWHALTMLMILGGVGVAIYGYLILKTRLADEILGDLPEKLRLKLKIK